MWPRGALPLGALLRLLLFCVLDSDTAAAKKPPVALEANFKERITLRLNSSAEAALEHMTARLGIGPYAFSGYELNFKYEAPPSPSPGPALLADNPKSFDSRMWTHSCMSVDPARDAVEYCALRQVYALGALCDANGFVARNEVAKELVIRHLDEFATKEVPSLGLQNKKFDGTDIWFHRKTTKSGPDDVDVSPAMQSTVMATVVRCANVVGKPKYFQDAESWFKGLQKVFPPKLWNATWVGYHKNSIVWESLSIVAESLPKESSFHSNVVKHLELFEAQMRELWEADTNLWSFASARALAMRLHGKLRTKTQRTLLKKWVREHVDRFLGPKAGSFKGDPLKATERELTDGILARVGTAKYTCGPLQGLVSLATVLSDAEIITVVLQLLEKDVGRYQMRTLHENGLAPPFEPELDEFDPEVVGGFFRDEAQMDMEKRRSIRVDDTAQCVVALTTVLRTLDGIAGVTVDEGGKEPELPTQASRDPEELRQAREAEAKAQIEARKRRKRAGGSPSGRDPAELAAAAEKARQAAAQRLYKEAKQAEAAAAAEDAKPTVKITPAPPPPPTPSPTASSGAEGAGAGGAESVPESERRRRRGRADSERGPAAAPLARAFRPPPGLTAPPGLFGFPEEAPGGAAAPATPSGASTAASDGEAELAPAAGPPAAAGALASVGSALHASGGCKPCGWFWKKGGCENGTECRHCHLCPADALIQRKKKKIMGFKDQLREAVAQAEGSAAQIDVGHLQPASPQPEQDPTAAPDMRVPVPPQPPPGLSGQQEPGSALHASGMCRPCGWFWKPQGCANGSECLRCHACPRGEILRRKRDKGARLKHAAAHAVMEEGAPPAA